MGVLVSNLILCIHFYYHSTRKYMNYWTLASNLFKIIEWETFVWVTCFHDYLTGSAEVNNMALMQECKTRDVHGLENAGTLEKHTCYRYCKQIEINNFHCPFRPSFLGISSKKSKLLSVLCGNTCILFTMKVNQNIWYVVILLPIGYIVY